MRIDTVHKISISNNLLTLKSFYYLDLHHCYVLTVLHGMFRGYPLTGQVLSPPEGYTGVVLKETRPGLNSDEPRTMKAVCQFKNFTFWNWDRKPSRADKYQQAMDWAAISDLVSWLLSLLLHFSYIFSAGKYEHSLFKPRVDFCIIYYILFRCSLTVVGEIKK